MRFKKLLELNPPFQPFRKVEPNPPFSSAPEGAKAKVTMLASLRPALGAKCGTIKIKILIIKNIFFIKIYNKLSLD